MTPLRGYKGVIDIEACRVYLRGPGDAQQYSHDLEASMPPGTVVLQGKFAPSGHMVLQCDASEQLPAKGGLETQTTTLTVASER